MFSPFFFVILLPSLIGITGIALGAGDSLMINNASELIAFSNSVNNGTNYKDTNVLLNSDIDFTGLSQQFEPIGKEWSVSFQGTFDGQGYTISNFNPSFSSSYKDVGLFGFVGDGSINNVVMDSSCSISSAYYGYPAIGTIIGEIGGEASYISNSVNMASLTFSGDVKTGYIGGVVGYFYSVGYGGNAAKNCVNYGTITVYGDSEYSYIGGIVGYSAGDGSGRTISICNCLNYGTISHKGTTSKDLYIGGIVGFTQYTYLENCVSAGKIEAKNNTYVASMIGFVYSYGEMTNSFWTSDIGTSKPYTSDYTLSGYDASQVDLNTDTLGKLNTYSTTNSWSLWLLNPNNASVSFKINRGKGFTVESQIILLPDPAESNGRAFSGWHSDEAMTTPFNSDDVGSGTTLHGMFCEASNYAVTLDVNGGDSNSIPSSHQMAIACSGFYGELPRPTRIGYTFAGWSTDVGGGDIIASGDEVTNYNNHTLFAQWVGNKYTITFDVNGGNELAEDKMTVTFDSPYGELPRPTRTGHTFAGWTNDKNESVTSETIVSVPSDHTLFAQWTINEYAITFEFNNGTEPEVRIFVFGTPIDYPEKPMKTGYTSSWDKALETMPAENLTITTQWSPIKYTITFNVNGGNELAEDKKTVTFNSSYGELPTPNKTGHTFAGWTNDRNESVTSETIVSALSDHTLHAQWEEIVTTQVEIVFDAKDMSAEEIEKIVRVHTKAEFTITRVEDDATGETKVIIEFTDTTKAEEFVRSVRTFGERSDNKIKKVDYTRREVNQDLSPSLQFMTAILLTAIFTI